MLAIYRAERLAKAAARAQARAYDAFRHAYPVGTTVVYRWGAYRGEARVIDHGGLADLRLRLETRTGKFRWVRAAALRAEDQRHVR